jgi:hypothetical protein
MCVLHHHHVGSPQVRAGSEPEVEAFVHGALCVSYSGQCFSSEVSCTFGVLPFSPLLMLGAGLCMFWSVSFKRGKPVGDVVGGDTSTGNT